MVDTQLCSDDPDFIDLASQYEALSGINLGDYEALSFGLFSRCGMVDYQTLQSNPNVIVIQEKDFFTTAIPRSVIRSFFSEFNITPALAKARIQTRDFGANDFTVFRDRPLIAESIGNLPIDVLFILEKFASGPYWKVNSVSKATGDRLRRFWGRVFESYVNEQLTYSAKLSGATFLPQPRWADDPSKEVCDALVLEGDNLLVIEYKSSMFSAEGKYSGDHNRLLKEITTKLVRDEAERKKKGVEQLADAISQLQSAMGSHIIDGLDLRSVRTVYPLLLTLDNLGGSLLMSTLLNTYFDEFLKRNNFSPWSVRPLFCTDIESLEIVIPFGDIKLISTFLEHWLQSDASLSGTLSAYLPEGLVGRRNEVLYTEWEVLAKDFETRLFPNG